MSSAALKRRLMGKPAPRPTRRNELLSKPRLDPEAFAKSLQVATGMSDQAAAAIAKAFPGGRGLEHSTLPLLESLGATRAQAKRVRAAFNFVRVCDQISCADIKRRSVDTPQNVVDVIRRAIANRDREFFAVVLLDDRNRFIDIVVTGVGTLTKVDVHPRELFKDAIAANAAAVIIAHNHPSGDPRPSNADLELTERMVAVGRSLGISVLDHIIMVSRGRTDNYTSLDAAGLMPGQQKTVRNEVLIRPMPDRSDIVQGLRDLGMSAKTAKAIAKAFPKGAGLDDAPAAKLEELGASRDQIETLQSAFGLVRMCDEADMDCYGPRVESPRSAEVVLRSQPISGREKELLVVLLLDARQRVIDIVGEDVGPGTSGLRGVRMPDIFRRAIQSTAHSIIVAHYHPGWDDQVTDEDDRFMKDVVEMGHRMGIPVVDYIVLGRHRIGMVSFAERGAL